MSIESGSNHFSNAQEIPGEQIDPKTSEYNKLGFRFRGDDHVLDLAEEKRKVENKSPDAKVNFYTTGVARAEGVEGTMESLSFKFQGLNPQVESISDAGGDEGPKNFITGQVQKPYIETYRDKNNIKSREIEYVYSFKKAETKKVNAVSNLTSTTFYGLSAPGYITRYFKPGENGQTEIPTAIEVTVQGRIRNRRPAEEKISWKVGPDGKIIEGQKPEVMYKFTDKREDLPEAEFLD